MQKKTTILLVEDDDGHAGLIANNLRYSGRLNDILFFDNGEHILDFLFKRGLEPYREDGESYVVLLDIALPGIDGIEVLHKIKEDKWVNKIPVIMISGTDDIRVIEQCRKLGCSAYFTKYPTYEEFSATIKKIGLYINSVF